MFVSAFVRWTVSSASVEESCTKTPSGNIVTPTLTEVILAWELAARGAEALSAGSKRESTPELSRYERSLRRKQTHGQIEFHIRDSFVRQRE